MHVNGSRRDAICRVKIRYRLPRSVIDRRHNNSSRLLAADSTDAYQIVRRISLPGYQTVIRL